MAVVLLAIATTILGGLGWFYFTAETAPKISLDTRCPVEGPKSTSIVLFDVSNKVTETSQILLNRRIRNFADEVSTYGLLEIRLLDPVDRGGKTILSVCKPKSGKDASQINENALMLDKEFEKTFSGPLEIAMSRLQQNGEQETSPILSTIQRIAVERFDGASNRPLRLLIVSDLMEHTGSYSQYEEGADYETFRKKPVYKETHTDLNGATISLLYISRQKQVSSGKHMDFWMKWIADNNGVFGSAEKLQGVN